MQECGFRVKPHASVLARLLWVFVNPVTYESVRIMANGIKYN